MDLDAVFLDLDGTTLRSVPVVAVGIYSFEEDEALYHTPIAYYLSEHGSLVWVDSEAAEQHMGNFVGFVEAGTDPEALRDLAVEKDRADMKTQWGPH